MQKFSERNGYMKVSPPKREFLSTDMRAHISNLYVSILERIEACAPEMSYELEKLLLTDFFKLRCYVDFNPRGLILRGESCIFYVFSFIKSKSWFIVFDFLEFFLGQRSFFTPIQDFIKEFNCYAERENCAYRLLDGLIVDIISDSESTAIEQAIAEGSNPWEFHIREALRLLSDKKKPDYRNSIKESISAVESLVKKIMNNSNATLGQLTKELDIHPSLKKALSQLYGYTNDAEGIRHSLIENTVNQNYHDALFMLVICSAFINYLKSTDHYADKIIATI